jgi:hypothetical protein
MLILKLRIDSQMFYLPPDEGIDRLKNAVLTAARGQAEFIIFTPIGHGQVSVLVTPLTPVRFEEQERTEEELSRWKAEPPAVDYWHDDGTILLR